jgi:hypothetical protein
VAPTRVLAPAASAGLLAGLHSGAGENGVAPTAPNARTTPKAASDLPEEVTPQRVPRRVTPVTKTKPSRRLEPGDLVCGECGEGNPPTRNFCSRCGNGLTTATAVRVPWWRRVLPRRRTRTMEAGTRPGQKDVRKDARTRLTGGYRKVRRTLAAVMLTVGLVYVAVPPLRGPVNRTLSEPAAQAQETVSGWWHALTYPYKDDQVHRRRALPESTRT